MTVPLVSRNAVPPFAFEIQNIMETTLHSTQSMSTITAASASHLVKYRKLVPARALLIHLANRRVAPI